ncbi:hypothetical protein FRC05_005666 [Tulasnella sp. 425]|nr:hypothetical protein FRC05_005666 [Tulasnella sp. 425]
MCEHCMYRAISLPDQPRRSLRLLEALVLRPDLALKVQRLAMDFGWASQVPQKEFLSILRPDGMDALSLVKSLRSFGLSGGANWIWQPGRVRLRDTIFNEKLVRLERPLIQDPRLGFIRWPGTGDLDEGWGGDLGAEIRKLLKAQPLLEDFSLSDRLITSETFSSLETKLQPLDIPSLKFLKGSPWLAMAFFLAAA